MCWLPCSNMVPHSSKSVCRTTGRVAWYIVVVSLLSCVQTVCDPVDYSQPVSSVPGISQARILEQVAILLWGIFLTQESNLHLLHWQLNSLPLSHQGSPVCYIVMRNRAVLLEKTLFIDWDWSQILLLLLSRFSCVRLCATPQTAARQASPSLGFSRKEHWSGLPFPSPMHQSEKWKWSCSVMSDSPQPHGLQPTRLLRPWDFPGKSTGVGAIAFSRSQILRLLKDLLQSPTKMRVVVLWPQMLIVWQGVHIFNCPKTSIFIVEWGVGQLVFKCLPSLNFLNSLSFGQM